ncbi:bZIP transcription factor 50 [Nymphaea colorata]|nr:bZIP transcription factor 50 [Nymphaea colorata]
MDEGDDADLLALLQSLVDPPDCPPMSSVPSVGFLVDPPDCPSMFSVPSFGFQQECTLTEACWAETVGSNSVIGTGTPPERAVLSYYLSDETGGEVWMGFNPSYNGESSNGRIPVDSSPIDGDERLPSRFADPQLGAVDGFVAGEVDEKKENREAAEDLVVGSLRLPPDDPPSSSPWPDLEVVDLFVDPPEKGTKCVLPAKDEGDSDYLIKKRKRQMRNRDSALRSRERKKTYVKDLEMKSRFLEFECRRLQQALALCCAENHALRVRAFSLEASTARQESAVLRTESLPLDSLLWLVALVWRVFLPLNARSSEEGGVGVEEGKRRTSAPVAPTKRVINERLFGSRLVLLRRRCRAARKKMKGFRDFAVRQCILGLGFFLAAFVSFCFF